VRKALAILLFLVLISLSLANPLDANLGSTITTALIRQDPDLGTAAVLVEGFGDIGSAEASSLGHLGTVTTVAGQVAVLHAQTRELLSVARLPFVSRIQKSWPLQAYLDKSVPDTGANIVWDQGLDSFGRNVTGSGVIVGFVDTGIDVSHPDFGFPNGTTKILYVWDQTTNGKPPSAFAYGYECNAIDIQIGACPENDTFGHGTHVAGIAASSGRATGNYTGIAPGASIIFVKSGHAVCSGTGWTFDSAEILDGVNYIATKAKQLGRRAVINLSLGGNIGGHDGSDPLEKALDQFVKAGTPIVVAAGNQEQDNAHIRGRLATGRNVTFYVEVEDSTTDLAIDVWYNSGDAIDATLNAPNGNNTTIRASSIDTSSRSGNVTVASRSSDHGKELYFEVSSDDPLPLRGWSITLKARHIESEGAWDSWVDTASCASPGASFLPGNGYIVNPNDTIGIPGTAQFVVTVGAYVTKTSWRGLNGQALGTNSLNIGGIASYSSWGPTRDGRIKPDVAAPGGQIASARSKDIAQNPSDPDRFHRMLSGTSMAAPHVSGTIALMLQRTPNLEAAKIPQILRETARQDHETGFLAGGSQSWGYGKVDARAATGLIRITLVVNGLPLGVEPSVRVDGRSPETATDSWLSVYFPQGTNHVVTVADSVITNGGIRYELANAELFARLRIVQIPNYGTKTSVEFRNLNETTFLILNYETTRAPNPLILALPSIALLALAVAFSSLAVDIYLARRRRRNHSTQNRNQSSL
jgi:subtilisin family serine protease